MLCQRRRSLVVRIDRVTPDGFQTSAPVSVNGIICCGSWDERAYPAPLFPRQSRHCWGEIESSIEKLTFELDNAGDEHPVIEAVAGAVARVFEQDDLAIMRVRLRLIALTHALRANRSATLEGWRHVIIGFIATVAATTNKSRSHHRGDVSAHSDPGSPELVGITQ